MLDYNWWRYQRVVDIGGAYGSFLARVLRHNTRAAGVLFDQPQVASPLHCSRELLWACKSSRALCGTPAARRQACCPTSSRL